MGAPTGLPRHRYDVRSLKIEDGKFHECTGNIVAVLSASYNPVRRAWYITGFCRTDQGPDGEFLESQETAD